MGRRIAWAGLILLGAAALAAYLWLARLSTATATADPAFFEQAILAFEEDDGIDPPTPGEIVFVGSSSIRFWDDLAADMAPLTVLNRGFGGAQFSHLIHNVHRVVTPYAPRMVVIYAGDNDLAEGTGKTAEVVFDDYRRFVDRVREKVPRARIYFLAIKPSLLRWERWPEMRRANHLIEVFTQERDGLDYLDVASPLLGGDGSPQPNFFMFDGLHLSDAGYAAWTRVVRPRLLADSSDLP